MNTYMNCETVRTGLYKPHTLYINSFSISIVYWKRDNKTINDLCCIAFDNDNNKYEIYKIKSIYGNIGFLAFPVNPEKIKGFFPWL